MDLEAGVADLVEEQRAAGRGAHDALIVVDGAGERAATMAEQLRIEHVLGRRRAVEGQKDRLGAGGEGVNRSGEDLFAGAGFARDQDRNVRGRDTARDVEDVLHFLGLENRAALALDWIGWPESRAVALFLARAFECNRGAPEAKNVPQDYSLMRLVWNFAHQCQLTPSIFAER